MPTFGRHLPSVGMSRRTGMYRMYPQTEMCQRVEKYHPRKTGRSHPRPAQPALLAYGFFLLCLNGFSQFIRLLDFWLSLNIAYFTISTGKDMAKILPT